MEQGQLPNKPTCPTCGQMVDGYTAIGDVDEPDEGSFTVCFYCGTLCVFTQREFGLELRALNEEEIEVFMVMTTPRVRDAVARVREKVRKQHD